MNYADLKWSIIQEWNSDAKFTNEYLIEIGAEAGVEIKKGGQIRTSKGEHTDPRLLENDPDYKLSVVQAQMR